MKSLSGFKIPLTESFMKDKKIDDLLYGYLLLNSHYNCKENYLFCYKRDVKISKITNNFKEIFNKDFPYTAEDTIRTHIKLLIKQNFIQENEINTISIYKIIEPERNYFEIDIETLI